MLNENYRAEFKPKARVVAHGFEDKSLNESEKETSTCSKDTFSTAVGLAIKNNWDIQAVDIKTAFLQGENTDWDNFVIPPPEANCPKRDIWKLNKCIYGLTDASLKWYSRMKFISKSGCILKIDPTLFIWYDKNGNFQGFILVHVDDFPFAGSDNFHKSIIRKLKQHFW